MNGSRLSSFRALDDDVGVFGDISFEIESDQNKTFTFYKVDEKSSDLVLVSPVEEKIYEVSIDLKTNTLHKKKLNSDKLIPNA